MSGGDTSLGGPGGAFPSTLWSVLEEVRDRTDDEARSRLGALLSAYWKPVYLAIRGGWRKPREDAKDLTQSFFAWLLDGEVLRKVERGRGRFRGFLKAVLRNYLNNTRRSERQLKRGGGRPPVALDISDPQLEAALPAGPDRTPEEIFDREWARSLLESAMEEFERRAPPALRDMFRAYGRAAETGDGPAYEAVAASFGMTRDAVKHHLASARELLRAIVLERIREYALDDVEIQQELDLLRDAWR